MQARSEGQFDCFDRTPVYRQQYTVTDVVTVTIAYSYARLE